MNLPQDIINILAGLAFSVGGWFARVIWVAVRDLEKDLARLREDLPRAGTAATQDHMIYGKRKNSPLTAAYFDRFSHALELESW